MRILLATLVLGTFVATGCTDDTLSENTAYRRVVDAFSSESHCIAEGNFNVCYHTLTLCESGRTSIDLANRPQIGSYLLDGTVARAELIDMYFDFDLETMTSKQLPGRNRWELVTPLVYDCVE